MRLNSELPCPTALGATRPSLVEDRVVRKSEIFGITRIFDSRTTSCFGVETCTRRGHSVDESLCDSFAHQNAKRSGDGSRLRRRLPFTGGSECPTPTEWTLSHNRQCALLVVVRKTHRVFRDDETASPFRTTLEHCRRRGEYRTTFLDRKSSKCGGHCANNSCGRCIPSLLAPSLRSVLAEEGGLAPSITAKSSQE